MAINYLDMYLSYLNKQNKFPELELDNIKNARIFNEILEKIEALSGFNFESGEFDNSKFYNCSYSDLERLLSYLIKLYKITSDESLKNRLISLILKTEIFLDEKQKSSEEQDHSKENTTSEQKVVKEIYDPIQDKAKRYSDFAFLKSQYPNFSALTKPTANTKDFDDLSRTELVSMFDPKSFYALSTSQKEGLFQAVVNEYCLSNGVAPCKVALTPLHLSNNSVVNGQYVPARGVINLNSRLFDHIDELDNISNEYFPLEILSTLIHEATHRIQFATIEDPAQNPTDQLIKQSLVSPQQGLSYAAYLSEADELDARNSALKYLKENVIMSENPVLASFYNNQVDREQRLLKEKVPAEVKECFSEIYGATKFKLPVGLEQSMQSSRSHMIQTILSNNPESYLAKTF